MKSIISKLNINSDNKVAAIEIFSDGTSDEFRILVINKKKSEYEIYLESIQNQNLDEETIKQLSDIPIMLIITGKNIIYKKELKEIELNIYKNNTDLYITRLHQQSNSFINIIRQVKIENCINKLNSLKNNIIKLDIGVFGLQSINSISKIPLKEITYDNLLISLNKNIIEDISEKNNTINENQIIELNGVSIQRKLLICLLQVLNESNDNLTENIYKDEINWIDENILKYQVKKMSYTLNKWISLTCSMIILVLGVCFFLVKHKNIELNKQIEKLTKEKKSIQAKEYKNNNHLNSSWPKKTAHSFYADRIAYTIPSKISLLELNINPLSTKKSKNSKEFVFNLNCIEIKGTCYGAIELNQWLTILKKQQWIKKIEVIEYKWNTTISSGLFELKITI